MDWVVDVISAIRSVRVEMNVPDKAELNATVKKSVGIEASRVVTHSHLICANARLESIGFNEMPAKNAAQVVVGGTTIFLPLEGIIDLAKERERLKKEIAKKDADIANDDKKLGNESFISKAPPEVVEEIRERKAAAEAARAKIAEALARIGGA
jgi:valyl-tRNA synthetase